MRFVHIVVPEKFSNIDSQCISQILQFRGICFQIPEIIAHRLPLLVERIRGEKPALDIIFFVIGTLDAQCLFDESFQ